MNDSTLLVIFLENLGDYFEIGFLFSIFYAIMIKNETECEA